MVKIKINGEPQKLFFVKQPDGSVEVCLDDHINSTICSFKTNGTLKLFGDVNNIFQRTKKYKYIKRVKEMN